MSNSIEDCIINSTETLRKSLSFKDKDYSYFPSVSSPFCLVAHIDTVTRNNVRLEKHNNIYSNKSGVLGADDRAGLYAALKIYSLAKVKPSLLFTDKEETGGIGAKQVAKEIKPYDDLKLLIELDRQGCNDIVTYNATNKKVINYAESFGFIESYGSYSDISDIVPAWSVPGINLSIGYYHQHTSAERLHLDETELTIQRVLQMLDNLISERYKAPKSSSKYDFYD